MNDQPQQQRKSGAGIGGVVLAVLVVLGVIGWVGAHASQSVQVTTCDTVLQQCSQTSYPVTTQAP
jgi:hypothetical protein